MEYIMDYVYFFEYSKKYSKKWIPATNRTKTVLTTGHPTDSALKSNFENLCKRLDEQTELFTVTELHGRIGSFAEKDLNVYCLQFFEPGRSKNEAVWK